MTIDFEIMAVYPYTIAPDDEFAVELDISSWLGADTISSAVYTAFDESGDSATSIVLDTNQCDETTTVLKPYIKGGTHDAWYVVKIVVSTANGDEKTFYLKLHCFDYIYSL